MIELKMYVSEVDFESAIQAITGTGLAGNAALMAVRALPDSAREELVVKYINANGEKIEQMLAAAAERKGVSIRLSGAHAAVVEAE